jgi:hypothetical protein
MALKQLEEVGAFSTVPYDSDPEWELSPNSGCDWDVWDLFDEEPRIARLHKGTIEVEGHLALDTTDGYGYYVIEGDLIVHGVLKVEIDGEYNVVVVMGGLQAEALVVAWEAQFYVLGDTTITGPMISELSDCGACYLNGKTVVRGLHDAGEVNLWLGPNPDAPKLEIGSRYSKEHCEDPIAEMLKDLRAGKPLT